jgi:hypothetical protein
VRVIEEKDPLAAQLEVNDIAVLAREARQDFQRIAARSDEGSDQRSARAGWRRGKGHRLDYTGRCLKCLRCLGCLGCLRKMRALTRPAIAAIDRRHVPHSPESPAKPSLARGNVSCTRQAARHGVAGDTTRKESRKMGELTRMEFIEQVTALERRLNERFDLLERLLGSTTPRINCACDWASSNWRASARFWWPCARCTTNHPLDLTIGDRATLGIVCSDMEQRNCPQLCQNWTYSATVSVRVDGNPRRFEDRHSDLSRHETST